MMIPLADVVEDAGFTRRFHNIMSLDCWECKGRELYLFTTANPDVLIGQPCGNEFLNNTMFYVDNRILGLRDAQLSESDRKARSAWRGWRNDRVYRKVSGK